MAKKSIDERKADCIADHKTGHYSQRKLADKHGISVGLVSKITKGVPLDLEHAVNARVGAAVAIDGLSERDVNAVHAVVDEKTKHLQFIHNATLKNLSVQMKKVNDTTTHQEHKFVQETLNKGGEALGVLDKGGTTINNTAQAAVVQNNKPTVEQAMQNLKDAGLPLPTIDD